jgi:hypothetical protein
VEFSYIVLPATLLMPDKTFRWPGVVMIMAPTPMKTEFPDAGALFRAEKLPSLSLSLEVTRGQFSVFLRLLEAARLRQRAAARLALKAAAAADIPLPQIGDAVPVAPGKAFPTGRDAPAGAGCL